MEEFKQGFIDEALQLVEKLEEILLNLTNTAISPDEIQEIFRIMHTIKGSASMFGFSNTEKLTHKVEDVYDRIRSGEVSVNQGIIDFTMQANDVVKTLLVINDAPDDRVSDQYQHIIDTANTFLPEHLHHSSASSKDIQSVTSEAKRSAEKYLYIFFKPDADILIRGISPLNALEELSEYGEITGFPYTREIPHPEDYDPSSFYLAWDLFIRTTEPLDVIEDCFMFYMENEFKVIEIHPENIESNHAFVSTCLHLIDGELTIAEIKNRLLKIHNSTDNKGFEEISASVATASAATQPLAETNKVSTDAIKVDSNKLDELINLVSEFVTLNSRLEIQTEKIADEDVKKTVKSIIKLSKRFRDNALELRLVPIQLVMVKLKRLIRDTSNSLQKEVEFITEGTQTELDKNIINKLESPLMHILRNCLDHGIESPDERQKNNKPRKGVIRFISFYSGSHVLIQIQDDGAGIDQDKVKEKAIEKGIIKKGEELSQSDIFNLLFAPGFSTAKQVSNISGRGVGLDAVKKQIIDLRGEIDIESEKGLGTSFTIKVPLTLSIIDTLMVDVGSTKLLIPREYIVHTTLFKTNGTIISDKLEFEDKILPVISLRNDFDIGSDVPIKQNNIIVKQYENFYALTVDKIIGEHQAVVKPLGNYNQNHEYFSGASILGDGKLAFILDVNKVINMKRNNNSMGYHNLK